MGRPTALGDRRPTVRAHLPTTTCARTGWGYAWDMLAVVVILPIAIILVVCLLERFEAHATSVPTAVRARRRAPVEPAGPALKLVSHGDDTTRAPRALSTGTDDTGTRELRRAS